MKISFIIIGFLMFVFLASINFVGAQVVVGVSPGNIEFKDILRGGYAERPLLVSVDNDDEVSVSVNAWGDIAEWINFSKNYSMVSRENRWVLKVIISPPRDVPNGNYTGFVRVRTDSLSDGGGEGSAVGTVKAVIDAQVIAEVSDREIKECDASNFRVRSVETGDDIEFIVDILNRGNIRLRPKLSLNIWDQDQVNIVKSEEYIHSEILPTTTQEVKFRVNSDELEVGQYWVDFSADDCFDSDTLTFDILEEGALRAEGVITNMITKTWVDVGETVPIDVAFKNIGEKEVDAQFRGKISYGDKIVNVLESQTYSVPVEGDTNFTFYYTPKEYGKYVVSGRVFYDKKRTFESSAIINVRPKKFSLGVLLTYSLYALIFASMFYLFYRVRKERINYANKLRRVRNI
jgi:hypothetical protein